MGGDLRVRSGVAENQTRQGFWSCIITTCSQTIYDITNTLGMLLLHLANELLLCTSDNLESERDINGLYCLQNDSLYSHNLKNSDGAALLWAEEHGQEVTAQRLLGEGS